MHVQCAVQYDLLLPLVVRSACQVVDMTEKEDDDGVLLTGAGSANRINQAVEANRPAHDAQNAGVDRLAHHALMTVAAYRAARNNAGSPIWNTRAYFIYS